MQLLIGRGPDRNRLCDARRLVVHWHDVGVGAVAWRGHLLRADLLRQILLELLTLFQLLRQHRLHDLVRILTHFAIARLPLTRC
jgi:hypothetical protein